MKLRYLLLFLVIFSLSVYAGLEIELDRDTFGKDKEVKGDIIIDYNETFSSSERIKVYVDNDKTSKQLKDILDDQNISYDLISGLYDLGNSFSEKTLYEEIVGIKIPLGSNVISSEFKLERVNDAPQVKIKINNVEEEYFGDFIKLNQSSIVSNTMDGFEDDGSQLLQGNSDYYCELIDLPKSKHFRIFSMYETLNERADMFGVILNTDFEKQAECKLPEHLDKKWGVCIINLNYVISGEYLICNKVKGGLEEESYFKLYYQENNPSNGYVCDGFCEEKSYDYLIRVKYGIFNKSLDLEAVFGGFEGLLNDYLGSCSSDDCILPLKITSSAEVKIKDLEVRYDKSGERIIVSKFYEITELSSEMEIDRIRVPLEVFELKEDEGEYELRVEFLDFENETNFSVSEIPEAVIKSNDEGYIDEEIEFSGSESVKVDREIVSYEWDFGDNESGEGVRVVHSYDEEGKYEVELVVTDLDGLEGNVKKEISIGSLDEIVEELLEDIEEEVLDVISNFESSNEKEVIELLGLISKVRSSKEEIESLKDLDDSKRVYDSLDRLRRETPRSLVKVSEIINFLTADREDVRDVLNFLGSSLDKLEVLEVFQNKINSKIEMKLFRVMYLDGSKEEYSVVKKEIVGKEVLSDVYLFEIVPFEVDMGNYNFVEVSGGFKAEYGSFKDEDIVYVVDNDVFNEVGKLKTVLISKVLLTPTCGNGVCDSDENSNTCGEDCVERKVNYFWFLVVLVVLVFGFVIYKFLPKLGFLKKKLPFKSSRNLTVLEKYVKDGLEKNVPKVELRKKLLLKGWKKDQIDYVMKKFK